MYEKPENEKKFLYNNINNVMAQRKGAGKRGAIIGGLSGMFAGIAIGLIQGDDRNIPPSEDFFGIGESFRMTAGDEALISRICGFSAGGLAGVIIGSLAQKKLSLAATGKNLRI